MRGMTQWSSKSHGIEGSKRKEITIRTFYLAGEADIWWRTVKNRRLELEFT